MSWRTTAEIPCWPIWVLMSHFADSAHLIWPTNLDPDACHGGLRLKHLADRFGFSMSPFRNSAKLIWPAKLDRDAWHGRSRLKHLADRLDVNVPLCEFGQAYLIGQLGSRCMTWWVTTDTSCWLNQFPMHRFVTFANLIWLANLDRDVWHGDLQPKHLAGRIRSQCPTLLILPAMSHRQASNLKLVLADFSGNTLVANLDLDVSLGRIKKFLIKVVAAIKSLQNPPSKPT